MRKALISFLSLFTVFLFAQNAYASGGFLPGEDYSLKIISNKAVISHNEDSKNEKLIISSRIETDGESVLWVIPTPTMPEVSKGNDHLFDDISKIVEKNYKSEYQSYDARFSSEPLNQINFNEKYNSASSVEVKSEIINIETIKASEKEEIETFLTTRNSRGAFETFANSFHFGEDDYYLTFVDVKLKEGDKYGLKTTIVPPIELTFETEKPYYPVGSVEAEFSLFSNGFDNSGFTESGILNSVTKDSIFTTVYLLSENKKVGTPLFPDFAKRFSKKNVSGTPIEEVLPTDSFFINVLAGNIYPDEAKDISFDNDSVNNFVNAGMTPAQKFLSYFFIVFVTSMAILLSPFHGLGVLIGSMLVNTKDKVIKGMSWALRIAGISGLMITLIGAGGYLLLENNEISQDSRTGLIVFIATVSVYTILFGALFIYSLLRKQKNSSWHIN